MHASVLLLCLVPLVRGYDLAVGLNNYGKSIFNESRQASPAIWRQKENVTIEAQEGEVITKVIVIDKRPEKDGDARIVDGGEGKRSVTVELRSPTVFRGYDFHISVYSAPANLYESEQNQSDNLETKNIRYFAQDIKLSNSDALNTEPPQVSTVDQTKEAAESMNRPARTTDKENAEPKDEASTQDSLNSPITNSDKDKTISTTESNVPTTSNDASPPGPVVKDSVLNETSDDFDVEKDRQTTVPNDPTESTGDATTTSMPEIINGKDIPELNTMKQEEKRRVRRVEESLNTEDALYTTTELTTSSDTADEYSTETTSISDEGLDEVTRYSRGVNDISDTTETDVSDATTELTTSMITETTSEETIQGTTDVANDMRHARQANKDSDNTSGVEDTQTTTEIYSGDGEDESNTDLNSSPSDELGSTTTDISVTTESNVDSPTNNNTDENGISETTPQNITPSILDEMLRNPREAAQIGSSIFGDNGDKSFYPIFGNQSQANGDAINTNDYVYVPVIALISKTSYQSFQDALQNLPGQQVNSSVTN